LKLETQNSKLCVAILAAGKGKRMLNPDKAKVMFELNGKPMLGYVVETAQQLSPQKIILIVGWQKDSVIEYVSSIRKEIIFVEQKEQLGTGHAIMQIEKALNNFDGNVLVLSGDVPLLSISTLQILLQTHIRTNAIATILAAQIENPFGYGRIIHNENESVQKIVEEKDANNEEKKVNEINSGIYLFNKEYLFDALKEITPNNSQQEYYLTDVFHYFWKHNLKVAAVRANNPKEILGVNNVDDLKQLELLMRG